MSSQKKQKKFNDWLKKLTPWFLLLRLINFIFSLYGFLVSIIGFLFLIIFFYQPSFYKQGMALRKDPHDFLEDYSNKLSKLKSPKVSGLIISMPEKFSDCLPDTFDRGVMLNNTLAEVTGSIVRGSGGKKVNGQNPQDNCSGQKLKEAKKECKRFGGIYHEGFCIKPLVKK